MVNNNEDDPAAEHSRPFIRICKIEKNETGSYGFHLTRTKWDPYPWIAGVDDGSVAQASGLKVGDCILEVNGEDVIGLRVGEIAEKALSGQEHITMLLWNAGSDLNCDNDSLCCTPMPTSLSRLSSCLSSILSFLECPVCLEIIPPPAYQCPLGHLICHRCREEIDRCPVCRTNLTREHSLLADQIYTAVIEAFHLKNQNNEERTKKLWERIFGKKKREKAHSRVPTPKANRAFEIKNKLLTRLIGKSSSVDNLSSQTAFTPNLRKKSISSTDIYSSSAKRMNYAYDDFYVCSSESLPNENGMMSGYSSATNSCEKLNGYRNHHRSRGRNTDSSKCEHSFQFSTDISTHNEAVDDNFSDLYLCPLSDECTAMPLFSLLTHLQKHGGPLIQYFKSEFVINFPFSFKSESIFYINCYEKSFFLKILIDTNNNIKIYVWLAGTKQEAEQFKIISSLYGAKMQTEVSFITYVNTISSTGSSNGIYTNQILITNGIIENYFPDKFFTMHLSFIKK